MPYDEQSFLDGLAAGLTATAGRSMGLLGKTWTTGTRVFPRYPTGDFDTFVSKMYVQSPCPLTIVYEYGPDRNAPEREFRRVSASRYAQTIAHVVQLPETVKSADYHYNVYLFERGDMKESVHFWAGFMLFPYLDKYSKWWFYPGRPELVDAWYTQTNRGGSLLQFA